MRAVYKDNFLQEHLFIVLTLLKMVPLCHTMAILHFKICMPLRWLASNTHFIDQQGYELSMRYIDKAINALYDAMIAIQQAGSLYLNDQFMNAISDNTTLMSTENPTLFLHHKKQCSTNTKKSKPILLMVQKSCPTIR